MYDPRRRIWYDQAIVSPKDVIIAVDMSGSMTGNIDTQRSCNLIPQRLKYPLPFDNQGNFFNGIFKKINCSYHAFLHDTKTC